MIMVRLMGGLGNQMFQYAFARSLASLNNAPLKLDLSTINAEWSRPYQLHHLNITAEIATPAEIAQAQRRPKYPRHKLLKAAYKRAYRALNPNAWRLISEPALHFHPDMLSLRGNLYVIEGYWHSDNYFTGISDTLRHEFTPKTPLDPQCAHYIPSIEATDSVSLHIRRGDYVSNANTNQFHGVLDLAYYQRALDIVTHDLPNPHIFIFSDDPAWVTEHITLPYPTTHITYATAVHPHEDMHLMSLCQHNIIANSSFSWWGAWLNRNPHKRVVAPHRWLTDPTIDTTDHVPQSWQRI